MGEAAFTVRTSVKPMSTELQHESAQRSEFSFFFDLHLSVHLKPSEDKSPSDFQVTVSLFVHMTEPVTAQTVYE